jgi:orotidine-5'-phosphate decarboxylase
VSSAKEALELVDLTIDYVGVFKIGMQLFYAEGPDLVHRIKARGRRVFLDLKLHDIPNTVASAIHSLADLQIDYLTVHASGGPAMLRAAQQAAGSIQLLAVTVLTSMDEQELVAVGVNHQPNEQVRQLAQTAAQAGISGLVCSALEARALKAQLGDQIFLVCPGIRPTGSDVGDQRRIATPAKALHDGANLLVVGRPIRSSDDPRAAAQTILESMS